MLQRTVVKCILTNNYTNMRVSGAWSPVIYGLNFELDNCGVHYGTGVRAGTGWVWGCGGGGVMVGVRAAAGERPPWFRSQAWGY